MLPFVQQAQSDSSGSDDSDCASGTKRKEVADEERKLESERELNEKLVREQKDWKRRV